MTGKLESGLHIEKLPMTKFSPQREHVKGS